MRHLAWASVLLALAVLACGDVEDGRSADPYRMAERTHDPDSLRAAAERIEAVLAEHAPEAAAALQPGLPPDQLRGVLAPLRCRLPEEAHQLYAWRAGARSGSGQPFVGRHRFLAVTDAVDEYRDRLERADEPAWRWEESWFPLFELYGEHYVTACTPGDARAAPIRWVTPERPDSPIAFTSLTTLLQTAAEWYESGAVDVSGSDVTLDVERMRDIHRRLNPGAVFPYGGLGGG